MIFRLLRNSEAWQASFAAAAAEREQERTAAGARHVALTRQLDKASAVYQPSGRDQPSKWDTQDVYFDCPSC